MNNESFFYLNIFEFNDLISKLSSKGLTIQRFKGLGEMNAEQLRNTTLDPNTRVLVKINVEDAEIADRTFSTLMGEDVAKPEKEFYC